MKVVLGGVATPLGFYANGISCGIKKSGKKDLALIYSEASAVAAAMFTPNKLASASVLLAKKYIQRKKARAIIVNSGNANCANGKVDFINAEKMCATTATQLCLKKADVLVASTGIIGRPLPINTITKATPQLVDGLSKTGSSHAAAAIMTTDTVPKQIAVKVAIGKTIVTIGGMAKGVGMIYPHLVPSSGKHATMLVFITTDAAIGFNALNKALITAAEDSFNAITVDGCMSTNDSLFVLANGRAKNKKIAAAGRDFAAFSASFNFVCLELAKKLVLDAEGATKFVTVTVGGAKNYHEAKTAAFAVANSNLFKTAVFGENENWGRIIAAIGGCAVTLNQAKLKIKFSSFKKKDVAVRVNLGVGKSSATVYTSDLSFDYVKINAHYN